MKCILLDMDGVLFDTAGAIRKAVQETRDAFDLAVQVDFVISETLNILEGRKSRLNFLIVAYHFGFLSLRHPLRVFKIKKFYEERFRAYTRQDTMLPGAKRALGMLERFRLAIVTSRGREWAEASLKEHGISPYFEVIVTTDDVKKDKPDPGPILKAVSLLKVAPQDCFYVGDLPSDIRAGKRAGVKTAAVLTGLASGERLTKEKPDFLYENLLEFAMHVDSGYR
ncbi:MAG: HAD-IA family hydrolase [Theionarchaea archaeon]|nr:HAD-IA family hydrolase [Theionarchaea archaeon]